jgi:hypothetical protein
MRPEKRQNIIGNKEKLQKMLIFERIILPLQSIILLNPLIIKKGLRK